MSSLFFNLNLTESEYIKTLKGRVHDYKENSYQAYLANGHYQGIKTLAVVVETAVKAPFICLRQFKRCLAYLGSSGRKVIISIAQVPLALKRMLWPSYQDMLQKKILIIEQTIHKGSTLNMALLIGTGDQELSHEEKKHLMQGFFYKGLHPSLENLVNLMNQLTEDIQEDAFSEIAKQAKEIGKNNAKQFPKLATTISFFIEVFQEERKKELSLANPEFVVSDFQIKRSGGVVESPSAYLKQLLRHPNTLKSPEVEKLVREMPVSALRRKVLSKLEEINKETLQKMHSTEDSALSSLLVSLKPLNQEQIDQKFDSSVEMQFLQQCIQTVEEKKATLQEGEFFYFKLLDSEQNLLKEQQSQVQNTYNILNTVKEHLSNGNAINEENFKELQNWFDKRIAALKTFTAEELRNSSLQINKDLPSSITSLEDFLGKIHRIHYLEKSLLDTSPKKTEFLAILENSSEQLIRLNQHIKSAHQASPWKELEIMTTSEERTQMHQRAFAKKVISFAMKKHPEYQELLRIANQGSLLSEAHTKIRDAAKEVVTLIQEKHLLAFIRELSTFEKFIAKIEASRGKLDNFEEVTREDIILERFVKKLQVSPYLQKWGSDLQQIWKEHLSREQEQTLLSIQNVSKREEKMQESFASWFFANTSTHFTLPLSFAGLEINNLQEKRGIAFKVLQESEAFKNFRTKIQKTSPTSVKDTGISHKHLARRLLDLIYGSFSYVIPEFSNNMGVIATSLNSVDVLKDLHNQVFSTKEDPFEQLCQWIKQLSSNSALQGLRDLPAKIIEECIQVTKLAVNTEKEVPLEIIKYFIDQYRKDLEIDLTTIGNSAREKLLSTFLKMLFSGSSKDVEIPVTETQRNYLVQFCALSDWSSAEIKRRISQLKVVEEMVSNPLIEELGSALQTSPIGLEGLEESTIQKSFQESTLAKSEEVRKWIDFFRARSGNALLEYFLEQDVINIDFAKYYEREKFTRVFMRAFKEKQQEGKDFILKCLNRISNQKFNEATLAPALDIFLLDLLSEKTVEQEQKIRSFNKELIFSNNMHKMLMGYAREISYLSVKQLSSSDFVYLMKCKIAYQELKSSYFHNKREISDFLKMETDRAEDLMSSTTEQVENILHTAATSAASLLQDLHIEQDPFSKDLLNKIFKNQENTPLSYDLNLPGFFSLGAKIQFDAVYGTIYYDGIQRISLPPYLQNDSDLRALSLHNLPYTINARGEFCYLTEEQGEKISQVVITESPISHDVIIQRRLCTDFSSFDLKPLQFIPKETLKSLPHAIYRMGIQSFWHDGKTIYGYSQEGELLAKLSCYKGQYWEIATKKGTFTFLKEDIKQEYPALEPFFKSFNSADILVKQEEGKASFWVPSIDLFITKMSNKEDWRCEGKNLKNMVLDLKKEAPLSCLLLRREGVEEKKAKIQQQLDRAKRILKAEKKAYSTPSLYKKEEIFSLEQKINGLKKEMDLVEGCLCLTTLPEKAAFEKKSIGILKETLRQSCPNNFDRGYTALRQDMEELCSPFIFYQEQLFSCAKELKRLNQAISLNPEPGLREDYLIVEAFTETIREEFKKLSEVPVGVVVFSVDQEEKITSQDLSGALFLAQSPIDPFKIMKELAKYPLHQPLTEQQFDLLKQAQETLSKLESSTIHQKELLLYLHLLEVQHFFYRREKTTHTASLDKEQETLLINKSLETAKSACINCKQEAFKSFELLHLWGTTAWMKPDIGALVPEKIARHTLFPTSGNPIVSRELVNFSSQTLLERFNAVDCISWTPKNGTDLFESQKNLIKEFSSHSPEQVKGFYLEEIGRFSESAFCEWFCMNENGQGIAGISKKTVLEIFQFIKEKKWIERRGLDVLYSLSSKQNPLTFFEENGLRAILAGHRFSDKEVKKIVETTQAFFHKTMQASFTFSIKEKGRAELASKLAEEKRLHRQKYLDAEAFLKEKLPSSVSLIDLKYAVLAEDYRKFANLEQRTLSSLRNAFIRYLFHKTEVQHIENIEKAPMIGERNKIELLNTKRNYAVDLLLEERSSEEQIVQRAFLAFEEDYGFRCNAMQINMFRSLLLSPRQAESIDATQARMGFGKTALLPLLSIIKVAMQRTLAEEKKYLVRYVVPRAVIEDNTSSFNQRLFSILGSNVIKDREFSRYQIDQGNQMSSLELILQDLDARLAFYKAVRKNGDVLIQWPEIRNSMEAQELDFGQLLATNSLEEDALKTCMLCKKRLGEIRSITTYTVFDELDDTQDIKSREVNYTQGTKTPIPKNTIIPLEKLITLLQKEDCSDVKQLARTMLFYTGFQENEITDDLVEYLTDKNKEIPPLNNGDLKGLDLTPKNSALFLIRAILIDSNIFSLAKSKQPNTHFGVRFIEKEGKRVFFQDPESGSSLLIAVPYEGTNTPKGLSVFDNTEVAAITTIRYYLSEETLLLKVPHLDFLIEQTKKKSIPTELEVYLQGVQDSQGKSALEKLQSLAELLDEETLKKAKDTFYTDFMKTPTLAFRKYLGTAIVAVQVRSDQGRVKSDRYESGSPLNIVKGCSGTIGGTSSYFRRQKIDPAADGKLSIEIMGRANNAQTKTLTPPNANKDYLIEMVSTLLTNAQQNTRAIIDAAGMCKSKEGTPEAIVQELWQQLQSGCIIKGIEGIIYYGQDNIKRLYRGPELPAILCTTEIELLALSQKKYFSFYGQKNTRGSDIKQANGIHALVTIDENVTNSDAKQAILRLRNLVNRNSEQTFSFAFLPDFEKSLLEKRKSTKEDPIVASEVASFLRKKEKDNEEMDSLSIFRKEMAAYIKQAAAHLEHDILSQLTDHLNPERYQEFLQNIKRLVPFVESLTSTLYDKYGFATKDQDREAFIKSQKDLALQSLEQLFHVGKKFARQVNVEVRLQEKLYQDQIDWSIELFTKRFNREKPVSVANNSEGTTVSEALAEALAEAQAESLAQNLSESEVQTLDKPYIPKLIMSKKRHVPVTLDFLQNDINHLRKAEDFSLTKDVILPELRKHFFISPHLEKNESIVSHFVLAPKRQMPQEEKFIFVTQEEADLFISQEQANFNYALYDARTLKSIHQVRLNTDPAIGRNIFACILQYNGVTSLLQKKWTTSELRESKPLLANVTNRQLLPTLAVTSASTEVLQSYLDLTILGITRSIQNLALSITPTLDSTNKVSQVDINIGEDTISIPRNNQLVNKTIQEIFTCYSSMLNKFLYAFEKVRVEKERLTEKIEHIRVLERQLEEQEAKQKNLLNAYNPGQFILSGDLRRELSCLSKVSYREHKKEYILTDEKLEKFIEGLDNIQDIRDKGITSSNSAMQLEQAFQLFVSSSTIDRAKKKNVSREQLWAEGLQHTTPLEDIYDHVVFGRHGGGVIYAKECQVKVCQYLFQLMPDLIEAVGSLTRVIDKIKDMELKKNQLKKQIEELQAKIQEVEQAEVILKTICEKQETIGHNLQREGIDFDSFLDRFHFENVEDWQLPITATLVTKLPDYVKVVENMKEGYQKDIFALTSQENDTLRNNEKFLLKTIMPLAGRVENRKNEVNFIDAQRDTFI